MKKKCRKRWEEDGGGEERGNRIQTEDKNLCEFPKKICRYLIIVRLTVRLVCVCVLKYEGCSIVFDVFVVLFQLFYIYI